MSEDPRSASPQAANAWGPSDDRFGRAPRRAGSGCLPWIALGLLLALGASVLFNLALLAGNMSLPTGGARTSKLTRSVVEGEGEDEVALIELSGTITEDTGPAGPFSGSTRMVTRVREQLEEAAARDAVKAVVLRIDSPGGAVSASDQIWKLVTDFQREAKRPVVVSMGGLCASGGYYVAAPADRIIAEPTTITGSIGVIMSGYNFASLAERVGVTDVTIKAGANKDLLNALRPPNPEHEAILQSVVDDAYTRFVGVIAAGRRELDEDAVRALADGRVYTAQQALDNKLIDQIGYLDDAFAAARDLANLSKATVVRFKSEPSFFDALAGRAQAPTGLEGALAPGALLDAATPRLYYLWR